MNGRHLSALAKRQTIYRIEPRPLLRSQHTLRARNVPKVNPGMRHDSFAEVFHLLDLTARGEGIRRSAAAYFPCHRHLTARCRIRWLVTTMIAGKHGSFRSWECV